MRSPGCVLIIAGAGGTAHQDWAPESADGMRTLHLHSAQGPFRAGLLCRSSMRPGEEMGKVPGPGRMGVKAPRSVPGASSAWGPESPGKTTQPALCLLSPGSGGAQSRRTTHTCTRAHTGHRHTDTYTHEHRRPGMYLHVHSQACTHTCTQRYLLHTHINEHMTDTHTCAHAQRHTAI